jgi:hypothetical protein
VFAWRWGLDDSSVLALVLRGALWQILIGLGLGIPAALLGGHLMASQLLRWAAMIRLRSRALP